MDNNNNNNINLQYQPNQPLPPAPPASSQPPAQPPPDDAVAPSMLTNNAAVVAALLGKCDFPQNKVLMNYTAEVNRRGHRLEAQQWYLGMLSGSDVVVSCRINNTVICTLLFSHTLRNMVISESMLATNKVVRSNLCLRYVVRMVSIIWISSLMLLVLVRIFILLLQKLVFTKLSLIW